MSFDLRISLNWSRSQKPLKLKINFLSEMISFDDNAVPHNLNENQSRDLNMRSLNTEAIQLSSESLLKSKLEKLISSEQEISRRLQKFDQKYKFYESGGFQSQSNKTAKQLKGSESTKNVHQRSTKRIKIEVKNQSRKKSKISVYQSSRQSHQTDNHQEHEDQCSEQNDSQINELDGIHEEIYSKNSESIKQKYFSKGFTSSGSKERRGFGQKANNTIQKQIKAPHFIQSLKRVKIPKASEYKQIGPGIDSNLLGIRQGQASNPGTLYFSRLNSGFMKHAPKKLNLKVSDLMKAVSGSKKKNLIPFSTRIEPNENTLRYDQVTEDYPTENGFSQNLQDDEEIRFFKSVSYSDKNLDWRSDTKDYLKADKHEEFDPQSHKKTKSAAFTSTQDHGQTDSQFPLFYSRESEDRPPQRRIEFTDPFFSSKSPQYHLASPKSSFRKKKSKVRIADYIKDISRQERVVNRSAKKVKGFNDLDVIMRNDLWLKAKLQRREDLIAFQRDKIESLSFKPTFSSKKYADKLGINQAVEKKRDPISRRGSQSHLSSTRLDQSYCSLKSGKSLSRALRQSRSYSGIHKLRKDYRNEV